MVRDVQPSRRRFLTTSLITLAGALLGMLACSDAQSRGSPAAEPSTTKEDTAMQQMTPSAIDLPNEVGLPSLGGAIAWLNSQPLMPDGLRGKVVLVEFLTYTCINWLRTLPYVRAWSEKYRDLGLVVIGVHTPEFSFEKDVENVRRAMTDLRVPFPVAVDSNYSIWQAFSNHYWPALYFADAMGKIRHYRFGEGDYERSEMILQRLLVEAGYAGFDRAAVSIDGRGIEAAADWTSLRSPENYVGYERTEQFASPGGAVSGRSHVYTIPARLRLNQWALAGDWTVNRGNVALNDAGGRIVTRFHARDLHLVMGPAARGTCVRFRVLFDGQAPGAAHGVDIDGQGNGTATEQRMHQLIRQLPRITDCQFEIEFLDPGLEAFAFTFG